MKATKAELEYRITIVLGLIAQRYTRKQIIHFIQTEHEDWNISDGMIDIYCSKARDIMYDKMDRERDAILAEAINDLENLYKQAIKEKKLSEARKITIEKTKLYDLYKGINSKTINPKPKENTKVTERVTLMMEKIEQGKEEHTQTITYQPQSEFHKKTMKEITTKPNTSGVE